MKELNDILDGMKSGKTCGPGGIPAELFKHGGKQFDGIK